ncbi:MAG: hypothetical protein J0H19_03120 [Rhodospirillales bacterium]|nr:hypothetical protein [Rhodospirillales bacterium]
MTHSAVSSSAISQDRAIERSANDILDRGAFVDSLICAVVHTDRNRDGEVTGRRSTGFVVGLTGEWGLGKSSVLNLVKERLDSYDHVAVAALNPWLFNSRDDLLKAYFNVLRDALGKTLKERARDIQEQLDKYKGAIGLGGTVIAAAIDLHGGAGFASKVWSRWGKRATEQIKKPLDLSPDEERRSLETKLRMAKVAVVVLIDELDRVEDDEVRAVAQLIKAVGDIRGISYLVAYDPKHVAQALGRGTNPFERQSSGEAYLEKIVQFAVPLRPLLEEDARALLQAVLRDAAASLPPVEHDYQSAILNELIDAVQTPREIKRLIGAFAALEQMVRHEICPYDVLGYSWLLTKAPTVRDAIARSIDTLVDDPGEREMFRRAAAAVGNRTVEVRLAEILGDAVAPHERMLKLLFPRLGTDDDADSGIRISRRRNLVRLLYLGDPPGSIPRAEIERLWSTHPVTRSVQALRSMLAAERIAPLLDRILDLLPQLPAENDTVFWPALARILVRQHDWIRGPEALGSLVEDAGRTLWLFGKLSEHSANRVRAILDSLIAGGDLLIAPWLLRKHLFAHNMTSHARPIGGEFILTKDETANYLERELPRYMNAITDGMLLKRLPCTEVLYFILNAQRWTSDLRTSLTSQLDDIVAITTFAALTVPPKYLLDKETMNKIIDGEVVLCRLVEVANEGRIPADPWLRRSLLRLVATLRGHDPHAIRDQEDDSYILRNSALE